MKAGASENRIRVKILNAIISSMFCLLVQLPPVDGSGPPAEASDLSPLLLTAQEKVQKVLDEMDQGLAASSKELAGTGLDSPEARSILTRICPTHAYPFLVDCCTVSPEGRMLLVEPAPYKSSEGADISGQEQIVRLHATKQPVMSRTITMVEGFDAVDLEHPVCSGTGELLGSVSMLIRSESLFASLIPPVIKGHPVNIWVMETNGRILYDANETEIGRNLFQDATYMPFEELRNVGARMASERAGTGTYGYYQEGLGSPVVNKRASWTTVGLHGTEWRLVLIQKIAADKAANLGCPTASHVLERIGKLCKDTGLQKALARDDRDAGLTKFKKFFEENRGLYSVQWVDAKGTNRFGYPRENSIENYSIGKANSPTDQLFLAALAGRKATTEEQTLDEGGVGVFYLHPIYYGKQYMGMVYAICRKQ